MALDTDHELVVQEEPEEDEKYLAYNIATYPADYTLSVIADMFHKGDIEIPEFQREFVWEKRQASLLIESFLRGIPVPPVFFHVDENNKALVIDGQQRIMSVIFYFGGYFGQESAKGKRGSFRLEGLDESNPYHKKLFSELSEVDQRKLRNSVLRTMNIKQLSPDDGNTSIYHIFERLNTGGKPLKPQEIRNCVFRGKLVNTLRDLNKNEHWRSIIGRREPAKSQQDIELLLRLFALSGSWRDKYEKPMKEYLNKAMKRNRDGASKSVQRFVERFPTTTKLIISKLGKTPFHRKGLNTATMDSVFCAFLDNSKKIPDDVGIRFKNLCKDSEYQKLCSGWTTDTTALRRRFEIAHEYIVV